MKKKIDLFEKASSPASRQAIKGKALKKCRALASRRATKKFGNLLDLERVHGYSGFETDQWNAYYQDVIASCMGLPVGMRAGMAIKRHSGLQGFFKRLKRLF